MRTGSLEIRALRHQSGLSIVELMVAITISLILLSGVVQIFLSSKTSYRLLEATSRVQENGRFAIDYLTRDVRMAGYRGCYNGSTADIEVGINNPTSYNWDFATGIQGNEWTGATWAPALNALVSGSVVNGTDVLVVRGVSTDGIDLTSASNATQVFVDDAGTVTNGDIMIVSNCSRAAVFQVSNHSTAAGVTTITHGTGGGLTPGNASASLANTYGVDAQAARLVTNVYYVGTGASGSPALFRRTTIPGGTMQAQELVDDVENMQVLYGEDVDSDGVANRYVSANNVANMGNVVSVRISLLLRSQDNISSTVQSYTYNGTDTEANDRRVRRVYNTTIKIRNVGVL